MKKTVTVLLVIPLLAVLLASVAYGEAKVVVKDIMTITVNRAPVRTDVPPINVQGQTLVPIRSIFDAFAAEVGWFPTEKKVYIRKDTEVIWLQIGDAHAKVNDNIVPLQVKAQIYRGRTMVPLRFISEALGAQVDWNESTQTISIITRETMVPAPKLPAAMTPGPGETVMPPTPAPEPPPVEPTVPPEQSPDDTVPAPQ